MEKWYGTVKIMIDGLGTGKLELEDGCSCQSLKGSSEGGQGTNCTVDHVWW